MRMNTRRTMTCLTMTAPGLGLVGAVAAASPGDDPKPTPDSPPVASATIVERYRQIVAEFEAERKRASDESDKAQTPFESSRVYGRLMPDDAAYSRRMVDLAATSPKDPA